MVRPFKSIENKLAINRREEKKKLWISVYVAVCSAWNTGKDTDVKRWADKAVEDYEKTFYK